MGDIIAIIGNLILVVLLLVVGGKDLRKVKKLLDYFEGCDFTECKNYGCQLGAGGRQHTIQIEKNSGCAPERRGGDSL